MTKDGQGKKNFGKSEKAKDGLCHLKVHPRLDLVNLDLVNLDLV